MKNYFKMLKIGSVIRVMYKTVMIPTSLVAYGLMTTFKFGENDEPYEDTMHSYMKGVIYKHTRLPYRYSRNLEDKKEKVKVQTKSTADKMEEIFSDF